MSSWQLIALSALGLLSLVGLASTLGVRLRSCDERPVRRGELVVASVSAAYVLRRTAEAGVGQEVRP